MDTKRLAKFLRFLHEDLAIPADSLQLALRRADSNPSVLPMILWQYGLVSLSQLDEIFDWLNAVF